VIACQHGAVPVDQVCGPQARALVSSLNIEGQHRGAVAAARAEAQAQQPAKKPKVRWVVKL